MSQAKPSSHAPESRSSSWSGLALFSQGFRPFFLLAGIWAIVALIVWMHVFLGLTPSTSAFDPVAWHAHEMLFGYAAAVLAGFLLTAIPNWTGRLPLQGWPLIGLVALWLLGRAAMFFPLAPLVVALVDLSFLLALLAVAAREILAGRNWRNLPLVAALAVLLTAGALIHAGQAGWLDHADSYGMRLALAVFAGLIALVGGRIVPSFTRNWLARHKAEALPTPFSSFDKTSIVILVAALLIWVLAPESALAGIACIAAGSLHAARLARWRGAATLREPLLAVLHVGYAWLPIAVLLIGLAALLPQAFPTSAGLHALTTGAIATMTLAVMARAIRGHTGNVLSAGPPTTAIFIAITAAALFRVGAPWLAGLETHMLMASSAFWILAFAGFVAIHLRTLLTAYDRRPG
ncbi:MAG: NnrS family protein [Alphaproteobacteria bacterium]|nr:NnrS family protein [Alphaproteobacteria bacterium]